MYFSRIPYRETEDYIADSVANSALESYEKQSKHLFSLCDLGCGNGIVIQKILDKLNSSEIRKDINIHLECEIPIFNVDQDQKLSIDGVLEK